MSAAEMKLAAIQEISRLNNENDIKEILEHLAKISGSENVRVHNLSQHYDKVRTEYSKVLQRLAQ